MTSTITNMSERVPAIDKFYADLKALEALEAGWDGYKAPAICQAAIDLAAQAYGRLRFVFGNHCQPVPGGGGVVQLEWHNQGRDVELFISVKEVK